MRDPNLAISLVYDDQPKRHLQVELPEKFDIQEYDLSDNDAYGKFILAVKRDIRASIEYQMFINFLKEHLDMNKCSFYKNISGADTKHIKIHVHHDPFTLEDITGVVMRKRECYREEINIPLVGKEVMYLHYSLLVGLIPLAETPHELVHNNFLFVPTTHVMGRYRQFVDMYHDFILPEHLQTLENIEEMTRLYDEHADTKVLSINMVYLDDTGHYDLPRFEHVLNLMNERITAIRRENEANPILPFGQ